MNELFLLILLVIGAFIWLRSRTKAIREDQRGVIFRMGKLISVVGSGSQTIIPFIDTIKIIDLNTSVPDWHSFSKEELEEKVKTVALSEI
jgi:regulator of protease activity HflC (stomatin/prohibitin superfamily)